MSNVLAVWIFIGIMIYLVSTGSKSSKGICNVCNEYSDKLYEWPDVKVCTKCDKKKMEG